MEVMKNVVCLATLFALITITTVECRRRTQCQLLGPIKSKFTSIFYDAPSKVWGCSTQFHYPREVYIVHLRNPSDNKVTLNIAPREGSEAGRHGIIVILATPPQTRTLTWNVHAEGISNHSRHLLVVPRQSLVNENDLAAAVIPKQRLPSNNMTRLIRWATRRYGGVTSVLDAKEGNVVNLMVGTDSSFPIDCTPSDSGVGGSVVFRTPITPYGCDMAHNAKDRVVHIVEVSSAERDASTDIQPVVVHVTPGPGRRVPSHVTLVLQSGRSILWKVMAAEYQGQLEVVAKGQVEGDREMTTGQLDYNKSQNRLIAKIERSYGRPASYVLATLANHINLVLSPVDSRSPLNYPKSLRQPRLYASEQQRSFLERGMHTSCLNTGMRVVIRKHLLRGVKKHQLTLQDRMCQARENNTHFILETTLDGCGTRGERVTNGMTYENKVFIRYSSGGRPAPVAEDEGSGVGSLLSDDEDYNTAERTISVTFHCSYLTPGVAVKEEETEKEQHSVQAVLAEINLSRVETLYPIRRYPPEVAEGSILYATVGLKDRLTGELLNTQVHSCWFDDRETKSTSGTRRKYVIRNGCATVSTISWIGPEGGPKSTFSFTTSRVFSGLIYLYCQVVPCGQQCMSKSDYCVYQYSNGRKPLLSDERATIGHSGPFVVVNRTQPSSGTGISHPQDIRNNPFSLNRPLSPKSAGPTKANKVRGSKDPPTYSEVKPCDKVTIVNGLGTVPVVAIAFASFVIGILLMGAMWFIHSRTAPPPANRKPSRLPRDTPTPESSGQSTPNSTQPISTRT